MGKVALVGKITHVPSMYLSELDGPRKGTRQDAIDGHKEIARRCKELGVDTIVVFDTHWLVNASYHLNCAPHFQGTYTSNELPHFISNMPFEIPGNPALGQLLQEMDGAQAQTHQLVDVLIERREHDHRVRAGQRRHRDALRRQDRAGLHIPRVGVQHHPQQAVADMQHDPEPDTQGSEHTVAAREHQAIARYQGKIGSGAEYSKNGNGDYD